MREGAPRENAGARTRRGNGDGARAASVVRRTRATRPGPRSMDALRWLTRVGVVTVDPLSRALGMSKWTTYSHVQRLAAAGMVERVPTLRGQESLLVPTRLGLRAVGIDPRAHRVQLRPSQWMHYLATAEVAAWLACEPRVRWWRHEREFGLDSRGASWLPTYTWRGARHTHRPDLVAHFEGRGALAIEVELSVKSHERLRAVVAGWTQAVVVERRGVAGVLYIVGGTGVAGAVRRAMVTAAETRSRPAVERTVSVLAYDEVRAIARTGVANARGTGGHPEAEQSF